MTRVRVPAKVNLVLEVLGSREDGYHAVDTILQAVGLMDELDFEAGESLQVVMDGAAIDGPNLVEAAARLLAQECGIVPAVRITVTKRIPVAAGLGGGSADAMATLVGLDAHFGLGLGPGRLRTLGARLGSDVPFFLEGGTQRATGRGEVLTRCTPCPGGAVILVPPGAVPTKTARAYQALAAAGTWSDGARASGFTCGDPWWNAFDAVAPDLYPEWQEARDSLGRAGIPVVLAGAGPGVLVPAGLGAGLVPSAWRRFDVTFVDHGVQVLA